MSEHYDQVISIANNLSRTIAPLLRGQSREYPRDCLSVPHLALGSTDSSVLLQRLQERKLSQSSIQSILLLMIFKEEELRRKILSHWRELHRQSPSLIMSSYLSKLIEVSQRKFEQVREQLIEKAFSTIDEATSRFARDADAAAQSESESTSQEGLFVPRGHSKLAVAILIKAYSRTANITRAERLQLAEATKLQPRQVTIWFQNRRNRKPAPACSQVAHISDSPPPTSSTPIIKSKKRKADGLYDGEVRQPSQRRRQSTPEPSTPFLRDVFSGSTSSTFSSSSLSSLDSLASFACSYASKADTSLSSDSSLSDDEDEGKRTNGEPKTPLCLSFDNQVQQQLKSSSYYSSYDDNDMSNTMLFSDSGAVQLDFDDLGLDLDALVDGLPSFAIGKFDLPMLTPATSSVALPPLTPRDSDKTPRQSSFAVPNIPPSIYEAATLLNRFDIDAEEELQRAQQVEEWALGARELLEEGSDGEDEWFMNLQGLRTGPTNSPTPDVTSIDGDSSNVTTPRDIFDFSMERLFLDTVMEDNLQTFQEAADAGERVSKKGACLTLDIEAANRCSSAEFVATSTPAVAVE